MMRLPTPSLGATRLFSPPPFPVGPVPGSQKNQEAATGTAEVGLEPRALPERCSEDGSEPTTRGEGPTGSSGRLWGSRGPGRQQSRHSARESRAARQDGGLREGFTLGRTLLPLSRSPIGPCASRTPLHDGQDRARS